jgi:hypothetical protein
MKKIRKRRFWMMGIALVPVILGALFFLRLYPVIAMFGDEHVSEVLFHVWVDVLPTSKSGSYYRALASTHALEYNQLLIDHPEHVIDTENTILIFVPVLEALPGDTGESARITEEQINALQAELDWLSFFAGPSFQKDIERETQRFPLKNFIGMTMYEAIDFMDSNWPAELTAGSVLLPTAPMITVTPTPLICRAGPSADCLNSPSMVADSDGKWAYYVIDGVYFEYPSEWDLLQSGDRPIFKFSSAADASESLNAKAIVISLLAPAIWDDHVRYDRLSCLGSDPQRPLPLWNLSIANPGFKGSEFFWNDPGMPDYYLDTVFYHKKHQTMICFTAVLESAQALRATTPGLANENFETFHHILDSVKIWGEEEEITPTAVVTQSPWTSEVISGVYFEHPSEWQVKEPGYPLTRIFTLPSDSSEGFNTKLTIVGVLENVIIPQDARLDELGCSPDGSPLSQIPIWNQAVILDDFEGGQHLWEGTDMDGSGPLLYLEVVLYNREFQHMVCLITEIYPDPDGQLARTPDLAQENFPNFYRMLESIKIWNE